jgi:hypothetical protein
MVLPLSAGKRETFPPRKAIINRALCEVQKEVASGAPFSLTECADANMRARGGTRKWCFLLFPSFCELPEESLLDPLSSGRGLGRGFSRRPLRMPHCSSRDSAPQIRVKSKLARASFLDGQTLIPGPSPKGRREKTIRGGYLMAGLFAYMIAQG